ncbi:MAG: class I SAM-dependent methyltransferase [Chloroflexi bacterium]|nr:class I SAM-dependent methyltransferase [Chloroflexota bacterium]MCC6896914.1 class I SAM-dependent methyltransferase [Anaerolineae bacterium]
MTIQDYANQELLYNHFMQPALQSALHQLELPPGSVGLDAGCGPGGVLLLLDKRLHATGHIWGSDNSPTLLAIAREQVRQHGLTERVSLFCADFGDPFPLPDNSLDWVWTADVLTSIGEKRGFSSEDVMRDMARIVKPGGQVAVFLGNRLGAVYLPGYAHIENSLATAANLNFRKRDQLHASFENENVLGWMRAASLAQLHISAHIAQYQAPLHPDIIRYIQRYIFEAEYGCTPELKAYAHGIGLTEEEWQVWLDISDPQSPNYLLTRDDYYCVRFGILATGRVING